MTIHYDISFTLLHKYYLNNKKSYLLINIFNKILREEPRLLPYL